MKYIYKNVTQENQSVLLASKDQTFIGTRLFQPGGILELDYPGLNLYVPNTLSCIVIDTDPTAIIVNPVVKPIIPVNDPITNAQVPEAPAVPREPVVPIEPELPSSEPVIIETELVEPVVEQEPVVNLAIVEPEPVVEPVVVQAPAVKAAKVKAPKKAQKH